LRQLCATLEEWLFLKFEWPATIPLCVLDARTARILQAILVEVLQNAVKAAIKCKQPSMAVSVEWDARTKTGVIIEVLNRATPEGIRTVRAVLGPNRGRYERQVHGLRGLWQLELLCERLGQGRVRLGEHRFGSDELTIQLQIQVILQEVHSYVSEV
jgi:hypothetical protein